MTWTRSTSTSSGRRNDAQADQERGRLRRRGAFSAAAVGVPLDARHVHRGGGPGRAAGAYRLCAVPARGLAPDERDGCGLSARRRWLAAAEKALALAVAV